MRARGAELCAISVDPPEKTKDFQKGLEEDGEALGFDVVCDPSRQTTKAFGVHDADSDIALPAMLLLDRRGQVAWSYIGESMFDRPEEDSVLAQLDALARADAAAADQ